MDPQFYGDLELDASALLQYLEAVRASSGVHVTVTHLVGRAVAHGLTVVPELGSGSPGGASTSARAWTCSSSWRRRAARSLPVSRSATRT
jgi:hypothetical protein